MHQEEPERPGGAKDDEDSPSGLPEGEDEATPLGGEDADGDRDPSHDEDAMPGIPDEDEPEISG